MRILMIGDIVGRPGRQAVRKYLPGLRDEHEIDLVVGNGENSAAGFGITLKVAKELFDAGIDVISSGNHIWDNKDMMPHMDSETPVLRPLNYPKAAPGPWRGHGQRRARRQPPGPHVHARPDRRPVHGNGQLVGRPQ